jgi:hypothetical protein
MDNIDVFEDIIYVNNFRLQYGLKEIPNCKIIPIGYRCSSSEIIKVLNLKKESYPFDWTISKLSTIKDCLLNDFKEFLKTENYIKKEMNIYNLIDSVKPFNVTGNCIINTHYNPIDEISNDFNMYDLKLALIHHDIFKNEDYEYYKRCINRFKNILESNDRKLYLYIHNIIGINEYNETKDDIIMEFINFNEFIKTKSQNIEGLFFILVKTNMKHTDKIHCSIEKVNSNPFIYIMMTNDGFADLGEIFYGFMINETKLIIDTIKSHL